MFPFLWTRYQDAVGRAVPHRVPLGLYHIHGVLYRRLPVTRGRGQWFHSRASWDKVGVGHMCHNSSIYGLFFCYFSAKQLNDDIWDYLFFGGSYPSTDIPHASLE